MSAQARLTQEQRTARTRQIVARAAFEVIQKQGYASLRTSAVAAAAGISEGGLMHHFPNKTALSIAAVKYGLELSEMQTQQNLARYSASKDPILAIAEDSKDFYFSGCFEVALDVLKSSKDNAELQHTIASDSKAFRDFIENAWVEKLVEHGTPRDRAEEIVTYTTCLVRGFAIRGLIQTIDKNWPKLIKRWAEIFNG